MQPAFALADYVPQLYYASFLLFILSLGLSKISVVLFQARLTANLWQRRIFHGLAVFIGMWTAASFLALTVQCDVSHPWKLVGEQCSGTVCIVQFWRLLSGNKLLTP